MSVEEQLIILFRNELLDLVVIVYAAERVREKSINRVINRGRERA